MGKGAEGKGTSLSGTVVSRGRALTFLLIGAALLITELTATAIYRPPLKPLEMLLAAGLCLSVAALGPWPLAAGITFVVFTFAEAWVWTDLSLPTLGLFVVAAEWIAQRWYWRAGLVVAIATGAQLIGSFRASVSQGGTLDFGPILFASSLGLACAILAGVVMQRSRYKSWRLEAALRESEQALIEAESRTRQELIEGLHNSVGRDLSQLTMATNAALAQVESESDAAEALERLVWMSQVTMHDLRLLAEQAPVPALPRSLGQVVAECAVLLESRGIELSSDVQVDASQTSNQRLRLMALAVEEASFNALKYAAPQSGSDLQIASGPGGALELTFASTLRDGAQEPGPQGWGFGLQNLESRARAEGGTLQFGPVGNRWLVAMTLPSDTATPPVAAEGNGGAHDGI